jgi:hypothetical protein
MGESRYTSPTKEVEKWDLPELLGLVDRLEDGQSAVRGRNGDRGVLGRSNGASSGIQPSREERVERLTTRSGTELIGPRYKPTGY